MVEFWLVWSRLPEWMKQFMIASAVFLTGAAIGAAASLSWRTPPRASLAPAVVASAAALPPAPLPEAAASTSVKASSEVSAKPEVATRTVVRWIPPSPGTGQQGPGVLEVEVQAAASAPLTVKDNTEVETAASAALAKPPSAPPGTEGQAPSAALRRPGPGVLLGTFPGVASVELPLVPLPSLPHGLEGDVSLQLNHVQAGAHLGLTHEALPRGLHGAAGVSRSWEDGRLAPYLGLGYRLEF